MPTPIANPSVDTFKAVLFPKYIESESTKL